MWTDSPRLSSLPKQIYADADVIEKACAMLGAGGSDAFVSDYLGMAAGQVRRLRRSVRPPATRWPAASAPADEEAGDDEGERRAEAEARRADAERGSAELLAAILLYHARRLPMPTLGEAALSQPREAKDQAR